MQINLGLQNAQIALMFGMVNSRLGKFSITATKDDHRFPRDYHRHDPLRLPRNSAVHFMDLFLHEGSKVCLSTLKG